MKPPLRSVCLFALFISTMALAQSNSVPAPKRFNGLPSAREPHSGVPASLPQILQGAPIAQGEAGAVKATASKGEFEEVGFFDAAVLRVGSNARTRNPMVLAAEVLARR